METNSLNGARDLSCVCGRFLSDGKNERKLILWHDRLYGALALLVIRVLSEFSDLGRITKAIWIDGKSSGR